MFLTALKGFTASASLIVAIGAQNAFVIRQGLQRRHLLLTALACSLLDGGLITLGVLGFGQLITTYPLSVTFAKYFAMLFLLGYGAFALKSAFKSKSLQTEETRSASLKKTLLILFALSLLNPHAYLDTVVLLGTIASQQPVFELPYFAFGAISASFAWFFALTYGSRLLAPFFRKPLSWKIIDILTTLTLWGIAATLFFI